MLKFFLVALNASAGLWNLHMYIYPPDGTPSALSLVAFGISACTTVFVAPLKFE